jgi:hypothetical protein
MDLPHLVQAIAGWLLRSPSVHYAVLGGLLFLVVAPDESPAPTPRLVVPAARIAAVIREYEGLNGRPLTPEEEESLTRVVVDQELLYAYALRLGLDKEPVVEGRLSQIAAFVAENPHERKSTKELADEALQMGLSDGDLVVRRLLIDGARRLIRAGVLVHEPSDAMLEAYLHQHPEEFLLPARTRISHASVNARIPREQMEHEARELLARLRAESIPPERVGEYGDQSLVPANLPALPDIELERRFGHRFVRQLAELPAGSWEGPVTSRYGLHLVFVEERIPARVASLSEVRHEVRARARNKLADAWLTARLDQLRAEFRVEIQDPGSRGSRR